MALRNLEFILRAKIQAGLDYIRANPSVIDTIFNELSANSVTQLKAYLLATEVPILFSHPKHMSSFPCWALTMTGETPQNIPIGTNMESALDVDGNVVESYGEYVRKGYQIWTLSQDPDVTLILAGILQHILKSMRQDLTNLGFYSLQVAQQDILDLKGDLMPNRVFHRVTYISVMTEDTYVYIDTQASGVEIGNLGVQDSAGLIHVNFPTPP